METTLSPGLCVRTSLRKNDYKMLQHFLFPKHFFSSFFGNLFAFQDIITFENVIFLVRCLLASFCFGC